MNSTAPKFTVGTLVREGNHVLRVTEIRPQTDQIMLEGEAGELRLFSSAEFCNSVARGSLRPLYQREIEQAQLPERVLTRSERAGLDTKLAYIQEIQMLQRSGTKWPEIHQHFVKEYGSKAPSMRSLQRWSEQARRKVNSSELAPRYSARGNRVRTILPEGQGILLDVLEEFYCSTDRFNTGQITAVVNDRARKLYASLSLPYRGISRRTVVRAIGKILNVELGKGRLHPSTVRSAMRAALNYMSVEAPYERVEFDATPLNVLVVNNDGEIIGKPTLYLMIDCATGAIIAFHLSIQPESQETLLRLLEMAFTPREEALKAYGVKKLLPPPQLWFTLAGDNSAANHGGAMFRALQFLGCIVEFTQAATPQQKPFAERTNGSVKTGLVQMLAGSNISQEQLEKDPYGRAMREAKYTLSEVESLVARWICDVYMDHPLARLTRRFGQPCSPRQAMEILSRKYPLLPPPTPEEFRQACMQYAHKKVSLTRSGVRYGGFQYASDELYELFMKSPRKSTVEVRAHPLDISRVHVVSPLDQKIMVVAYNKMKNLPAISFGDAKRIRARNYKSDGEMSAEDYMQGHVKLIENINQKNKSGKVAGRQKAARERDRQEQAQSIKAARVDDHALRYAPADADPEDLEPLEVVSMAKPGDLL